MNNIIKQQYRMILLLVILSGLCLSAAAEDVDYGKPEHWLCLPGQSDACDVDLSATIIEQDGTTKIEPFQAAENPEFDCFYVYPTVSRDDGLNSDLIANEEELKVIESQFARFKSVCNTYAPLYRQITLRAVQERVYKKTQAGDTELAYRDIEKAFYYYLEHYNKGRPFALVGHSQGSRMLSMLLKRRLDNSPLRSQLVSALLIGAPIQVAKNSNSGGSFQNIPLCDGAQQVGCVVAYVSFRDDIPPPEDSLFGKSLAPNLESACVNPAGPGEDKKIVLDAYLGTKGAGSSAKPPEPWLESGEDINTAFVKVPGLLSADCVKNEYGSYLSVTVNADSQGPRVDDIVGDVFIGERRMDEWGLHLVDISIAQGNLIHLVQQQAHILTEKTAGIYQ